LRGLSFAPSSVVSGDFVAQCSQYVANLAISAQQTRMDGQRRCRTHDLQSTVDDNGRRKTT